jgi:hypothetical protein
MYFSNISYDVTYHPRKFEVKTRMWRDKKEKSC